MTGYNASPITLAFTVPGGFRLTMYGKPRMEPALKRTTRGEAMAAYSLRDYERLINGHVVRIGSVDVRMTE